MVVYKYTSIVIPNKLKFASIPISLNFVYFNTSGGKIIYPQYATLPVRYLNIALASYQQYTKRYAHLISQE